MALNRFCALLGFVLVVVLATSCKPFCPINSCQVRMVHRHGEKEFRGQQIWKKQNPKMGEKLPKSSRESAGSKKSKSLNKN